MGKTFLIIGNPSSIWMREYIKEIHVKNNDTVYITVFDQYNLKYKEEYEKLGVTLVPIGKKTGILGKIEKTINLLKIALKHKALNKFDLVEIHYPPHNFQAYIINIMMQLMGTKSFVMFWGSDILSITHSDAHKLEKILSEATFINKPSEHVYKVFSNFYGNKYNMHFTPKPLRFGTLALPYIKSVLDSMSKDECKQLYGIEKNKYSIAIGYNGKRRQQHISVLNVLSRLDQSVKNKLYLILHLVGIEDDEYRNDILEHVRKSEIEYKIIDSSLNFEQISKMRVATDIFIHAQTTDGLSGSIREALYSEAILINPKWICYDELEKLGLEYIQYDKFEDIYDIIEKILNKDIIVNTNGNKELIAKAFSWDSVYEDWADFFNNIIVD